MMRVRQWINHNFYRSIISVLVYVCTVASVPQENTNVTYIKIQPIEQNKTIQSEATESTDDLPLSIAVSLEKEFDRHIENFDITTENDVVETTTEIHEVTTKKPQRYTTRKTGYRSNPRFISKLSYYNKANEVEAPTNNFVENFAKRKYKSKCRCEKIWNCPKLQITVPRCPNEYFMCCF